MSVNLVNLYVSQFSANIQLLLQQKLSKFRPYVMSGNHVGKQASPVDQIGAVAMQPVSGRFQPMGRVDAAVDRRWVFPSDFDLNQLIDSFDKLKLLSDPQSSYVQNAVQAANRQFDDLIVSAFFGTSKTGETGSTSTTFPAANIVAEDFAAAADNGLTMAKLKEGRRLLRSFFVDLESEDIAFAITSKQESDLLNEAQVINLDYNDRPVLVDGHISRVLGMDVVYCERLSLTDTDDRQIPMWAKSGMYLGVWQDIKTSISQRNDLQGEPWQAYVYMSAGSSRLEENKIVQILCEE